jgi:hypothetical protein
MYENPRHFRHHRRHHRFDNPRGRRHHRFHNPAGDNTDRTERIKRVLMASLVVGSVALGTAVLTDKLIGYMPASISGSATISGLLQIAIGVGGAIAISSFGNVPSLAAGVGVGGVANGLATLWDAYVGASNPSLAINIPYVVQVPVAVAAPAAVPPATVTTPTTGASSGVRAGQAYAPGLPQSYQPMSQSQCGVPSPVTKVA